MTACECAWPDLTTCQSCRTDLCVNCGLGDPRCTHGNDLCAECAPRDCAECARERAEDKREGV